jgi:hypothetical protein
VSVIKAVTVTLYRAANRPKGWRKGKPRRQKALAYRDAAWAKMRARCKCVLPDDFTEPRKLCRYHDKEHRATPPAGPYDVWGNPTSGPSGPPIFTPPRIWGLPRSDEDGYWDYGRAVAYRLARLYAYLDRRAGAGDAGGETTP